MKIVIPMAGLGERFLKAGYTEPKPLIKVDGKPVIEHVVGMFPGEDDFVFICNNDHLKATNLQNELKRIKSSAKIIGISQHKLGPVWTVLEALKIDDFLDDNEPVIISYCDFSVWWNYEDFKETVRDTKCDVAVIAYKGFHPHLLGPQLYASMRVDEKNWMLESREKYSFTENKMDCFQQAGSYYFARGSIVKKYFSEVVKKGLIVNGEYYISGTTTQVMKESGLNIYVYPLENFLQWGTPKDMETYQFWSDYFKSIAGK
ncbi:MAG: NTP transferase domain-containing protein [Candidatus Aenigmarchaeota archaeon]|nr:NTP transferase domain-containing protein [Candidatus Aenigmarchaeota archaeon]